MSDQERLRAIAEAVKLREDRGRTHWDGCATDPRHRDCAITYLLSLVAQQAQEIERIREELKVADEAMNIQASYHTSQRQRAEQAEAEVARQAQEIQDLRTQLDKERRALEEREASCCPEDVSFEENIAALLSEIQDLRTERDDWRGRAWTSERLRLEDGHRHINDQLQFESEVQDLRARLASALAEREEALLSIGGVQSALRKAEFSRDALREALKQIQAHATTQISPGWESVDGIAAAALAETPTEDQR